MYQTVNKIRDSAIFKQEHIITVVQARSGRIKCFFPTIKPDCINIIMEKDIITEATHVHQSLIVLFN